MIFTMSFAMLSHFFSEVPEPAFDVPLFLSPLPTRPLSSVRDDKEVNEGSIAVQRRLFFAAQQRIAITWKPK
jgi:hypothetical protein